MNTENIIYTTAHLAGIAAAENCTPNPMVVNYVSNGKPTQEVVEDGVCGFAWVKMPNRGKFVKFLKEQNIGRKDSYEGGYRIWISDFNQSMQKKESYARAFCEVLNQKGIKAFAQSRMD